MKKYTFSFTIIDDEGNMKKEIDLSPEEAIDIMLAHEGDTTGKFLVMEPETFADIKEITSKNGSLLGDMGKKAPTEKPGKKSPAGARSAKAEATRESILKWHAKGWVSKDIVEKVGTVPSTVSKVLKDAGLTPNKKEKHERVADAMASTRTGRGVWHEKECCGSKGSRHMKTCKNHPDNGEDAPASSGPLKNPNPEAATEYTPPKARALSDEEFKELKEAQSDKSSFMSGSYALSRKLSPREVNLAVMSETYEEYIEKGLA